MVIALFDVDVWRAYSPIVPSLIRWQSGWISRSTKSRLSIATTLLTCKPHACGRSSNRAPSVALQNGRPHQAWNSRTMDDRKSLTTSPTNSSMWRPVTSRQRLRRSDIGRMNVGSSAPISWSHWRRRNCRRWRPNASLREIQGGWPPAVTVAAQHRNYSYASSRR